MSYRNPSEPGERLQLVLNGRKNTPGEFLVEAFRRAADDENGELIIPATGLVEEWDMYEAVSGVVLKAEKEDPVLAIGLHVLIDRDPSFTFEATYSRRRGRGLSARVDFLTIGEKSSDYSPLTHVFQPDADIPADVWDGMHERSGEVLARIEDPLIMAIAVLGAEAEETWYQERMSSVQVVEVGDDNRYL